MIMITTTMTTKTMTINMKYMNTWLPFWKTMRTTIQGMMILIMMITI